jgi:O-antigen/teichoic acid export membrane protein
MLFTIALAAEWAFQGLEKMNMVFISLGCTTFLQYALIFLFVKGPADLLRVPILYFIATIPVITVFLRTLRFRFVADSDIQKKLIAYLSSSLVIWAIALFAQIYNSLDIYILGLFRGMKDVGYFSVARRIVAGFVGLMLFMASAALPRLSSSFADDISQFRAATRKFFNMAILITVFVLLPAIVFSRQFIIITVGREYVAVSMPLKVMMSGLIFILFNLPFSTGLIASGHEKEVLKQTVVSALISIFSNFILVPLYGMLGAAIAFFLAEAMALMLILWIYRERINIRYMHWR